MIGIYKMNVNHNNCRKYKGFLPNKNPVINSLSNYISSFGIYNVVYITGVNFTTYGTSVNFGPYKNIPVIFFSSSYISFVVPVNIPIGNYNVQVTTNNNSNSNPDLLYSNVVSYDIV